MTIASPRRRPPSRKISRPSEQTKEATGWAAGTETNTAQVKDKPWVKRLSPLKRDPDKRNTRKYYVFRATQGHNMNNCFACKAHVEELVRKGHYTEFIVKQAIQQIEDRDTAKEPPQKIIRISTILADSEESRLTNKEKKRKIK
ncbi:unnamed protein product [Prunus armeniaca]